MNTVKLSLFAAGCLSILGAGCATESDHSESLPDQEIAVDEEGLIQAMPAAKRESLIRAVGLFQFGPRFGDADAARAPIGMPCAFQFGGYLPVAAGVTGKLRARVHIVQPDRSCKKAETRLIDASWADAEHTSIQVKSDTYEGRISKNVMVMNMGRYVYRSNFANVSLGLSDGVGQVLLPGSSKSLNFENLNAFVASRAEGGMQVDTKLAGGIIGGSGIQLRCTRNLSLKDNGRVSDAQCVVTAQPMRMVSVAGKATDMKRAVTLQASETDTDSAERLFQALPGTGPTKYVALPKGGLWCTSGRTPQCVLQRVEMMYTNPVD